MWLGMLGILGKQKQPDGHPTIDVMLMIHSNIEFPPYYVLILD